MTYLLNLFGQGLVFAAVRGVDLLRSELEEHQLQTEDKPKYPRRTVERYRLFTQTPAYRSASGTTDRDGVGLDGGRFFRDTLAKYDATSTAFVVSSVAESHPDAVRTLATRVSNASNASHQLLSDLDLDCKRRELARSKDVPGASHQRAGFRDRAPAFDITDDHFDCFPTSIHVDSRVVSSRSIPV